MKEFQKISQTVLKALAVGMAVASYVLAYLGEIDAGTQASMLAFGVFSLSVVALQQTQE